MENSTMTIEEKIAQIEALRDEYYKIEGDEEAEDSMYEKGVAMELNSIEFLHDEVNVSGQFYVCPDPEWEYPHVFEIAKEYMDTATKIIAHAYLEYYSDSKCYDTIAVDRDTLVAIRLFKANIPIIRHAGNDGDVELLNVRWLNMNC